MDDQEFCEAVAGASNDPEGTYTACMRSPRRAARLSQESRSTCEPVVPSTYDKAFGLLDDATSFRTIPSDRGPPYRDWANYLNVSFFRRSSPRREFDSAMKAAYQADVDALGPVDPISFSPFDVCGTSPKNTAKLDKAITGLQAVENRLRFAIDTAHRLGPSLVPEGEVELAQRSLEAVSGDRCKLVGIRRALGSAALLNDCGRHGYLAR